MRHLTKKEKIYCRMFFCSTMKNVGKLSKYLRAELLLIKSIYDSGPPNIYESYIILYTEQK